MTAGIGSAGIGSAGIGAAGLAGGGGGGGGFSHTLTVGDGIQGDSGFAATGSGQAANYGSIDPTDFEGVALVALFADLTGNGLRVRFTGNAQPVTAITVVVNGFDSNNPIALTFGSGQYTEGSSNVPLRDYFQSTIGAGNDVSVSITET